MITKDLSTLISGVAPDEIHCCAAPMTDGHHVLFVWEARTTAPRHEWIETARGDRRLFRTLDTAASTVRTILINAELSLESLPPMRVVL